MNVNRHDRIVRVSGFRELTPDTASALLTAVRSALNECGAVEIDLSELVSIDCRGLGVLVEVRNAVREQSGHLRLIHPVARVDRMFHASGAAPLFEIVQAEAEDLARSAAESGPSRSVLASASG